MQRLVAQANTTPKVLVAPIAAGEKVVASTQSMVLQFLQFNYGDAIAVEMEGRGILQAAHANQQVSALIVRGVSDLIDGKSKANAGGSQEIAARNASAFAFEILAKLDVNGASNQASQERRNNQPTSPNFFAYDQAWVGRESLINNLISRIRGSCRLLVLVGITGIGKTALGERLAVELEDWFEDWNYYLQENFDNQEQTSDFGSVAARLLEKAGEVVTPDDRKDTQRLLHRLVKHLQDNRYLIQIDSLEMILEGNEEEGWSNFKDEWWVKFIQTLLTVDTCESCLILTSQDLPAQIAATGTRSQNFWLCQPLSGLEELEQLALFSEIGLDISSEAEGKPYLERIGKAYEGYPLALRVIAGEIVNSPFNGNVLAYWNHYGNEIEEIEKAIEEAKNYGVTALADDQFNLHRYTRNLRRNVQVRLENTFNQLKQYAPNAYLLLCESSVYRCEVPEEFWLNHLEEWDIDEDKQEMALDALRDRYLVEERVDENNQYLLRQHNLIRSIALEKLKGLDEKFEFKEFGITPNEESILIKIGIEPAQIKIIKPRLKRTQYRAVINWLTKYKVESYASNLEKVRGYLEAFYHLCAMENWEAASKIILTNINSSTQIELYRQLGIWGYYLEQNRLCGMILGKLNPSLEINLLNALGNSFYVLGDYWKALDYLEQNLIITEQINDSLGKGITFVNLGKIYQAFGDYSKAIEYYQNSLVISQKYQYSQLTSQALINLGIVYENLGEYRKAIDYSQRSLFIARQIAEPEDEGQALGNLGKVYLNLGEYSKAIEYHQQHLVIAREIGDRFNEERCIGNLGNAYEALGDYPRAIDYYERSLTIVREISDRRGEGWLLQSLGNIYKDLGDYQRAIDYYQQSLQLLQEIQDRRGEGFAYNNLGVIYYFSGNYIQAIEYNQRSLAIAQEIGDLLGEEKALGNLGIAYQALEDYQQAIEYYRQQLEIAQNIEDIQGQGYALLNLGNVFFSLGNYQQAVEYQQQSLQITRQIGNRYGEGEALLNLGNTFRQLNQYSEALEYLQASLKIFSQIGSRANEAKTLKSLAELYQNTGNLNLALEYCDQGLAIVTELQISLAEEYQKLKNQLMEEA